MKRFIRILVSLAATGLLTLGLSALAYAEGFDRGNSLPGMTLTAPGTPDSVSTTPGTVGLASLSATGGIGGATTNASGTAGAGGGFSFTTGAGGASTGATAATQGTSGAFSFTSAGGTAIAVGTGAPIGGATGAFTVSLGTGGAASGAATTNTGGAGGAVSLTSGIGGAATGATTNVGGAGGAASLVAGAGGNGTQTGGAGGAVSITAGSAGTGGNANGGDITLTPGTKTGSGTAGATKMAAGNLTFTTTGQFITGDFTNATLTSRLMLQSSTTNGNTIVGAVPNGSATTAKYRVFGNSTPTNAPYVEITHDGTNATIDSNKAGSGTAGVLALAQSGTIAMQIGTSQDVQLGVQSALATNATTGFVQTRTSAGAPTGTPSGVATGLVAREFDTTNGLSWTYNTAWKAPGQQMTVGDAGLLTINQGTTYYCGEVGCSTTEANAQWVNAVATTYSNMYMKLSGNVGGSAQTVTATIRSCTPTNGACTGSNSTVTCQITTAGATAVCSDLTHQLSPAAGDLMSVSVVTSATSGSFSQVSVSFAR